MTVRNHFFMRFTSLSENVGIARVTAAAFAAQLELTLNEIDEIKVAISEAVSNSVIHGYRGGKGEIEFIMNLYADKLEYIITDYGVGIEDIEQARQPSYSSDPERMGLGFVFMESFMDELEVKSAPGQGTTVRMVKKISNANAH
ncbi:MAG: anti-sigma F factor [Negativicutes bacterium]|nr:anti-sigma F factor [Negativicutes bacterium]